MTVANSLRKSADLYEKKASDYAPDPDRPWQNFEYSAAFAGAVGRHLDRDDLRRATLVLIGVKLSRLMTVGLDAPAKNEAVEDTLDDLITYAAILKEQCVTGSGRSGRARR